jgi:hypothetical protein
VYPGAVKWMSFRSFLLFVVPEVIACCSCVVLCNAIFPKFEVKFCFWSWSLG